MEQKINGQMVHESNQTVKNIRPVVSQRRPKSSKGCPAKASKTRWSKRHAGAGKGSSNWLPHGTPNLKVQSEYTNKYMAARRLSKKMYKIQKIQKNRKLQNMNYAIYIYYEIKL